MTPANNDPINKMLKPGKQQQIIALWSVVCLLGAIQATKRQKYFVDFDILLIEVAYMKDKFIESAKEVLGRAQHILVLSGAGLSTEAGIPDFRSKNGLYSLDFHGYNPETILSHSFYIDHTELFYDYLRTRLNFAGILPDESYLLLAKLEAAGKTFAVLTQNIDSLHLAAGSSNVIELHGSLDRFYCDQCGRTYPARAVMKPDGPIRCTCGGTIRPDVVLFDEDVPKIADAWVAAEQSDVLLVLGTSLLVYPVAHIPQLFLESKKPVIIINRDPTPFSLNSNVIEINGEISTTLKKLFPDYFEAEPEEY